MPIGDRRGLGKAGMTAQDCVETAEAQTEKNLQNQVFQYLAMKGIFAIRSGMHKATSLPKGTPDFLFSVKRRNGCGVPVAVECKTATGRLSADQEWVQGQLVANGWVYAVVRRLDALQLLLRQLEKSE